MVQVPAPPRAAAVCRWPTWSWARFRLENGTVTYIDHRTGASERIDAIDVSLDLPDLASRLSVDGSLVYKERTIDLDVALASPLDLMQGAGTSITAKITADLLDLGFEGLVSAGAAPGASGQLDLDVVSLRQLAAWLAEPIALGGDGLEHLSITGQLDATAERIVFADSAIDLDDIQSKGELSVDLAGAVPRIVGQLEVGAIDLNRYLPPPAAAPAVESPVDRAGSAPAARTDQATKPERTDQPAEDRAKADGGTEVAARPTDGGSDDQAEVAGGDWSDAPIVVPPLDGLEVDFDLSVASLLVQELKLDRTRLLATLHGGRLELDLQEIALYGGRGQGRLEFELVDGKPTVVETFALEGLNAHPFLTDAAGFDRLEGTAAIELELRTFGDSERRLVRNLAGNGRVAFTDGALVGVNLAAMVRNVTSAFRGATAEEVQKTDFAELGGSFTIDNGLVDNDDMQLLAPLLRLNGSGRINLPKRRLNYRIEPKAAATLQGQGGAKDVAGLLVPVNIQGPWDDLTYAPDLASLAEQALQNPEKFKEALDQVGDLDKKQLQDAAKALLGGGDAGSDTDDQADSNPAERLLKGLLGR